MTCNRTNGRPEKDREGGRELESGKAISINGLKFERIFFLPASIQK